MTPSEIDAFVDDLSADQVDALLHDYDLTLRDKQKLPDLAKPWRTWLILSGRGFGKTHAGSMAVHHLVQNHGFRNIALVGPDASDVRNTMILKRSGIVNVTPKLERPEYFASSKIALRWNNGAIASVYSSEDPEGCRGENSDLVWMDELCAWKYMEDTYTQIVLGNRIGQMPRMIITTTPKPSKLLRQIMNDPSTVVTTGSTFENDTLSPAALETYRRLYEGTSIGRQELYGEVLDDSEHALFKRVNIDNNRIVGVSLQEMVQRCHRIVVAIDPSVSNNENSNETGIVVVGVFKIDRVDHCVVLEDASVKGKVEVWAKRAIDMYIKYNADRIVAEVNNGGALVEQVLRAYSRNISYSPVHASRGKVKRIEPVAALYEQGRIHHFGMHKDLEDQMVVLTSDDLSSEKSSSPDRTDAMVWGVTELVLEEQGVMGLSSIRMAV